MKEYINRLLNNEIFLESVYYFIATFLVTTTIVICISMLYGTYKYVTWLFS